MAFESSFLFDDAFGKSLYEWDISDTEEPNRIIDVAAWETIAITAVQRGSVTWDDTITIKWSALKGDSGLVDLDGTPTLVSTSPSASGNIVDVPYIVLQPSGTPDAGTTVDIFVYVTRGGFGPFNP
jgi:hypothetical protein